MNFTNNTGSSGLAYLSSALPESIASNLARSKKITVVERLKLKNVLDEIALQQTGLFEQGQVAQVGKLAKADLLLLGSYSGNPENLTVILKIVQVQSSQVLDGRTLKTSVEKVFDGASQSALAMVPVILGEDIGYLTVESNPEGAEVFVDGSMVGIAPVVDYRVAAGSHRVEVVKGEHYSDSKEIQIRSNDHAKWSPSLGEKKKPNFLAFSLGVGYVLPQVSYVIPDPVFFGRLQYHWRHFHVGAEIAYASLKHDQDVTNPFSGGTLTLARRYRDWFALADFVYYPFAEAQVFSPYAGIFGGYLYLRDTQLQGGSTSESDNLKLNAAALGGKLGFVVLPQALFHFFVEVRYMQVVPKISRKLFNGPTVTQDITVKTTEDLNFGAFTVLFGFTVRSGG